MRKFAVMMFTALLVAGCGGGSSEDVFEEPSSCSNTGQKQFVLDALYDWYLWNDMLPSNIDIADYATPEELVYLVTRTYGPQFAGGGPIDRWSFIRSAEEDQQYYGEGKYEGFGFSWREEGGEMRITGVYAGSPAATAGFDRGQTAVTLNGRTYANIVAGEGISAFFDANATITFEMLRLDASTYTADVTKDIVTITPIPQWRTIDIGAGVPPVGYVDFRTFVSTADPVFDQVFADFNAASVTDVVIDLRYNGGGLVSTAELLGDYLGGFANDGLVFSNTEFNADRAAQNNSSSFFARLGNSIDLTRVIIIASRGTASASEIVTNSMSPYADVWIVGDNTYGKPVGQVAINFCEKTLRPTAFKVTNADGYGDYYEGLPVDCTAADPLEVPVGADNDPNIVAAVSIAETGACPVASMPGGQQAAKSPVEIRYPKDFGSPAREFAGAY
jgi:C-terminal processing protease CtpA/Prc